MGSGLALHSLRLRRQRWEDKEKTRGRVAAAAQGERGAYQSEHAFGNGAVCKRVEACASFVPFILSLPASLFGRYHCTDAVLENLPWEAYCKNITIRHLVKLARITFFFFASKQFLKLALKLFLHVKEESIPAMRFYDSARVVSIMPAIAAIVGLNSMIPLNFCHL